MPDREYVFLLAGGRTLKAIDDFFEAQGPHCAHMQAIADELGCKGLWGSHGGVHGFGMPEDGTIPVGMRQDKREPKMLVPHQSTTEGRAIRSRMEAAPKAVTTRAVMQRAGMKLEWRFAGGGIHHPSMGWERLGEHTVVILRMLDNGEPHGGPPHDCERIPDSRYWLLREACEAAGLGSLGVMATEQADGQ